MRYFTFFPILLILFMSCEKESTEPEETIPTTAFSPNNVSVGVVAEGELTLQVKDFEVSIFGISMRIAYDSTIVTFTDSTGFTVGGFFGTDIVTFVRDDSSRIHLTITLTQGQGEVIGSGDLAVLTFTGKSPGSSTLEIVPSELYFYDSEGNEVIVPDLEIEAATIIVGLKK